MREYTFSIYYKKCPEGYCPNYPLEEELDEIAHKTGGRESGSGIMIGGKRDVQYVFKNELSALNFAAFLDMKHPWIDDMSDVTKY